MKDFKAKFTGFRYVALVPRIEITPDTQLLKRAYRGSNGISGREAATDYISVSVVRLESFKKKAKKYSKLKRTHR